MCEVDIYKGLSLLLFNIFMNNFNNALKSMLSASHFEDHYIGKGSKHVGEQDWNSKRSW